MRVLTLCWDEDAGEAAINFEPMQRLYGIERVDFLNDCIALLQDELARQQQQAFADYTTTSLTRNNVLL
jgi:uncharacterized small protein (DUF1192 family)